MASLKRKAGADLATSADPKKAKQQPGQQSSLMSFFGAPKGAPSAAASTRNASTNGNGVSGKVSGAAKPGLAPATPEFFHSQPKFDKAKWVAKLTKEEQQLLKLEIDTLGESWLAVLKDDLVTASFLELKRFLSRDHAAGCKIFPPPQDVYSWSRYTSFSDVKVVILGQDPYHNDGQAHGLAFSVKPPIKPPPSLKNIYCALKRDYPNAFQPPPPQQGGLLTPWAERGVLLLNTCLTVRAHEANSHSLHGWERFTQRIIDLVAQRRPRGVVFLAWGSPAAKRVAKIDETRHLVLRSAHPSPLSAHRGFFNCGHFRAANAWLMKRYGAEGEIDWSLLPGTTTIEGLPEKTVAAPVGDVKVEEKANEAGVKQEEKATTGETKHAGTAADSAEKTADTEGAAAVDADDEKVNVKVEAKDA
ncbi:uracil-DNA glucosyllase [Sporothrix schenckii 1099-18]|uniref:Uracil-DNA glycosylase n=2 Tax=Sporothrix schenckii TaxID=29908 RepID=U7Q5Y6_SPOS1|nr:uracil-DNA glucosyllase [Sporothrix schenckii 1099-18]ERT02136.1 uracil-DNA glycosylase [Sporothrix schenckii ATCC 58251]KJR80651.1 uracil-DNA glucosyllase [Sporothrix schenckii 1099-18]